MQMQMLALLEYLDILFCLDRIELSGAGPGRCDSSQETCYWTEGEETDLRFSVERVPGETEICTIT